jgi:hypothetical protein
MSKIMKGVKKMVGKILGAIFAPFLAPIQFIIRLIEKIWSMFQLIIDVFISLIEAAIQLFEFFLKFIEIFIEFISRITDYIFNPFKLLILLIQFFILFISFSFSFIYHTFAFLPRRNTGFMDLKFLECSLYAALFGAIYTPIMIAHFAYWFFYRLIIEYVILYNIDRSTGGYISSFMYRYFIACENPPDAWYMTPSWHKGNQNSKYIFAHNKCPAGYSTNNAVSLFCKRNNDYELTTCPQANLYRADKDLDTIGHLRSQDFNDKKYEFLKLKTNRQNKEISTYRHTVAANNNTCAIKMKSKDTLLKSVCMKTSDKKHKNTIQQLCSDIFCTNDTYEPICHKLSYTEGLNGNNGVKNNSNIMIILYIFLMIVIMVLAGGKFLNKPKI